MMVKNMQSTGIKLRKMIYKKWILYVFQIIAISLLFRPINLTVKPFQAQTMNTETVDYIFYDANIITIDEGRATAEAIAIEDGIIQAIGTSEDILANYVTGEESKTIFLDGQTMMPGFVDGHTHLIASTDWTGLKTLAEAQTIALSYGYTTLVEKSYDFEANLFEAEQADELHIRLNLFAIYNYAWLDENLDPIVVERWYPDNDPILDHDRMVRVPGIKIYADGVGGVRGLPAMSVPYTQEQLDEWGGTNEFGDLYFNQTELNGIVKNIHDQGFRCAFHAMGDRGIETVLNAIDYALGNETNDAYRHQIEHNSFIREDLITKAKELNTLHSMRGYFPTYWQEDYVDMFNATVLEWYVNRYSLPEEGVHGYWESDFTWAVYDEEDRSSSRHINPFLHLWGYVTRSAIDENGTIHQSDPWLAEHEITVEQALRAMTIEGAYTVSQEDYLGSLEPGKFADLIILSDSPLTIAPDELKDLEVWLTMVDGTIEYQKAGYIFPEAPTTAPPSTTAPPTTTSPPITTTEPTTTTTAAVASVAGLTSLTALTVIIVLLNKKRKKL
ncbi:MAG: amidohydrolase family protein [Candidatus Heimdallarchaeota archaeon]|nr:amidohydrolase family protein [Candidatus Heimdallarchaeota archaeon]